MDATCLNHEHTITDLRARCSVLEADAKRLDWIINHADIIATGNPGEFFFTGWTQGSGEDEASYGVRGRGKTPRESIDSAMEAK